MIVRRLAARRLVKTGSTEEEPKRKRAARFVTVILIAGTVAGIAAWLGVWPFGNIQTLVTSVFGASSAPVIAAQTVFPPVQPTHKTVDVYDQAPPARRSTPTAAPTSGPTAQPTARPSGSPGPPDD